MPQTQPRVGQRRLCNQEAWFPLSVTGIHRGASMAGNKMVKVIWAVLLIAMGVLLFVQEPHVIRKFPDAKFLTFARYFIAVMLIYAGGLRLRRLYFPKDKEIPPSDE